MGNTDFRKPGTRKQGKAYLERAVRGMTDDASKLLAGMKKGDIVTAVANDPVAIALLELEIEKQEEVTPLWTKHMRYKLRLLGRFIIIARDHFPNAPSLREILKRENFSSIVKLALETGEVEKQAKKGSTVPVKLGFILKSCMDIILSDLLEDKDSTPEDTANIRALMELYKLRWGKRVSSKLLKRLESRKINNEDIMPTQEDFSKLSTGLLDLVNQLRKKLGEHPCSANWRNLAEVLEARLIVYNAKRGSEVAQMPVDHYLKAVDYQRKLSGAIFESLSEEEKQCAQELFVVDVRGKGGRINHIIINKACRDGLDLLLATRSECGVPDDNPYMFAIPGHGGFLLSTPTLRKFINHFEVKNMQTRNIRKLVATLIHANPGLLTSEQLALHLGRGPYLRLFSSMSDMQCDGLGSGGILNY